MARSNAARVEETEQAQNGGESGNQGVIFEDGGSLVIDLSGVEEAKFELIPPGWYAAEIDGWEFGPSKNGDPQFVATYHILDPDIANGKAKLKAWYTFTQKGMPYVKANLCRFARDIFGGQFNPKDVAESGALIGRPVRVRIQTGEYEGEKRSNIANVAPPQAEGSGNAGGNKGSGYFA